MMKYYLPIILVTEVPKLSVKTSLCIKLVHPYHFGNKGPKFVCNIYARAIIVSLGLGRPSAVRELCGVRIELAVGSLPYPGHTHRLKSIRLFCWLYL